MEEEFSFMIEYYLGCRSHFFSRVEKGILTNELIERIKRDIENDNDYSVCSNKQVLIMH